MTTAAPPKYDSVLSAVQTALGFPNERKPLLIGIDGRDGAGKSALASWLAWQLEMPAIHLDMFMVVKPEGGLAGWRDDDLARAIDSRLKAHEPRPVIVEGVLLLDALARIGRKPNYLVYVWRRGQGGGRGSLWCDSVRPYLLRRMPSEQAHFKLGWHSANVSNE